MLTRHLDENLALALDIDGTEELKRCFHDDIGQLVLVPNWFTRKHIEEIMERPLTDDEWWYLTQSKVREWIAEDVSERVPEWMEWVAERLKEV